MSSKWFIIVMIALPQGVILGMEWKPVCDQKFVLDLDYGSFSMDTAGLQRAIPVWAARSPQLREAHQAYLKWDEEDEKAAGKEKPPSPKKVDFVIPDEDTPPDKPVDVPVS